MVGSLTELGAWEVDAAPAMHWQDGDFWNVDVTLPAGEAFEAKLVHLSAHSVTWEPGRNRCGRQGVPATQVWHWGCTCCQAITWCEERFGATSTAVCWT